MHYLNILLGLAMLGFAAVQYNDPDALLWTAYYLVPAAWTWVAAFRPQWLSSTQANLALWASVAAWLGLVVVYWPPMPGFWRPEVFMVEIEGQAAREGMGLMIAWLTLLVALFSTRQAAGRSGNRAASI
ncbi:MAG: hypothetical protein H6R06_2464 [Proteobacteria bacterium]|nr:hypothetical protein [Pseudomonadota bacterium]